MLGFVVFGAGFVAWMSSMVAVDLPNRRIEDYENAIQASELLMMMIDLPPTRVEEIEAMVTRLHPEVELEGVDADSTLSP